jgi:protein fantom
MDTLETQSEFSQVSCDGEVLPEQNFLDLIIKDAEYYFDSFKSVLGDREVQLYQKSLVTFVTVDFYNHDTETSQLAEGFRPLYNTQFSFMNKVDDFYVQFLQRQSLKLDVYISKNNAAVHLGTCSIHLRDLIEREKPIMDVNNRTPVIEKTLRVMGVKDD